MTKSKRLALAGVLVAAGLVYLIATAVTNTTMYYVTVDEALAQGLVEPGRPMRLNGNVVAGSIEWSPRELVLSFAVQGEEGGVIGAVYRGPKPDNFEAGVPAILEGSFDESGIFQVERLMLACPSRFEVAEAQAGGA